MKFLRWIYKCDPLGWQITFPAVVVFSFVMTYTRLSKEVPLDFWQYVLVIILGTILTAIVYVPVAIVRMYLDRFEGRLAKKLGVDYRPGH